MFNSIYSTHKTLQKEEKQAAETFFKKKYIFNYFKHSYSYVNNLNNEQYDSIQCINKSI